MRKQPPHSFKLFGNTWHVTFKDPMKVKRLHTKAEKKFFDTHPDHRVWGLAVASRTTGRRDIYIHPEHRSNWQTFGHEVLHALHLEMEIHRKEKGWAKWSRKLHRDLDQFAGPFGQFLKENL